MSQETIAVLGVGVALLGVLGGGGGWFAAVVLGKFKDVDTKIDGLETRMDKRFEQVDKRFDVLEGRFDRLEVRVRQLEVDVAVIKAKVLGSEVLEYIAAQLRRMAGTTSTAGEAPADDGESRITSAVP